MMLNFVTRILLQWLLASALAILVVTGTMTAWVTN